MQTKNPQSFETEGEPIIIRFDCDCPMLHVIFNNIILRMDDYFIGRLTALKYFA